MKRINRTPLEAGALRILRSDRFFSLFLEGVVSAGLVGEQINALVLYIVATSRLLAKPINLFIKGSSSSGKNFLAKTVLEFFPKAAIYEMTSSSAQSWSYHGEDLQHRIVYIQEQNKAAGNVHPARLLISENQLVRTVAVRSGRSFQPEQQVTRGPVACISTTTQDRLEIDDETRHLSVWIDDSGEQTRRIIRSKVSVVARITDDEKLVWKFAQQLLKERARLPIEMGKWSTVLPDLIWSDDVRVRRYFGAFLEGCKAVCLIRSFLPARQDMVRRGKLIVDLTDFAVASEIFGSSLSQSLSYGDEAGREVQKAIARISEQKGGVGVSVEDVASDLGFSKNQAYSRIRRAVTRGVIQRANGPNRGNRKLFLPAAGVRMIPSLETLLEKLSHPEAVRFVHPISGAVVVMRKKER